MNEPKVLFLDIETAPIIGYTWGLYDQNLAVNQIQCDWYVLSWAAKWLNSKSIQQMDQSGTKDIKNDKPILQRIWSLLDIADIVVTQNGKSFDIKKLNARFVQHGMKPPSSFKQIDTKLLAKKHFGFTSNSLEYLSDKLCTKYKKLKHKKFPGMELWTECLKGNKQAWKEMAKYNIHDVLSLEELYTKLIPWDNSINFNIYRNGVQCTCGSKDFKRNGFFYSSTGRFQRYSCKNCGSELRDTRRDKKVNRIGVVR